jgi:3-phenylpropionate/trans-cinnamate dioxygenase ferredoxin reductase subunit
MSKTHLVTVNGEQFAARRGDVLLDAALTSGVHIPHDCRSGHCGTCRVRIVTGSLFGADAQEAKACQCRVIEDVAVAVEEVPDVVTANGRVAALCAVAPDVVELCIWLRHPFEYLPGQYFRVQFSGYPARYYSPTVPLDRDADGCSVRLHVRRVAGGRVSQALGREIAVGHRVKLKGPFGAAYLRPRQRNPLVLVASGTGFAPIWSIADAAMRENAARQVVLLVGSRTIESLYMIPALWRLASCPNVTIIAVTRVRQTSNPVVQTGSPLDYLPTLYPSDIVYAAGPPSLVTAVTEAAKAAGATWYADPFVPSAEPRTGMLSGVADWLRGAMQVTPAPMASQARR